MKNEVPLLPIEILLKKKRDWKTKRTLQCDGEKLRTCLEDIEAISICAGVANDRRARKISRSYFSGERNDYDIFYAHSIGMNLIEIYGEELVQYCLTLPPVPFKCQDVTQVFSELDKARKNLGNPILRFIASKNDEKSYNIFWAPQLEEGIEIVEDWGLPYRGSENHRFSIGYKVIEKGKEIIIDKNELILKNNTQGKYIASIFRDGTIRPYDVALMTKPMLSLFVRFCKNPTELTVRYGFETGECGYCSRELTDPISVKWGYGPKCALNYALPHY